jgi:hypothetical protein
MGIAWEVGRAAFAMLPPTGQNNAVLPRRAVLSKALQCAWLRTTRAHTHMHTHLQAAPTYLYISARTKVAPFTAFARRQNEHGIPVCLSALTRGQLPDLLHTCYLS